MKRSPLPWSHSALDDFVNCPRAFFDKRVIKVIKEEDSEHLRWGNHVHKAFELRQRDGTPLPTMLAAHEPFMQKLDMAAGVLQAEQRIALNKRGTPCAFFDSNVWFRGVMDWCKVNGSTALITDYKTGKPHQKYGQLKLFALYLFAKYPEIDTVTVQFYWTQTQSITRETYTRGQISSLWAEFIPNLKQYVEAFKTDVWQPRPSGLCRGWCPKTDCEFWKPRKP